MLIICSNYYLISVLVIATFIRCNKLKSDYMFHKRDLINFICEKLLSTDYVVTGIVRQIVASALRFGYIASIMSRNSNSATYGTS